MKVASIQLSVVENDKDATLRKARIAIEQCSGADLIILPEIWNIGFMSFDRYVREAEDISGPTMTLLKTLAQESGAFLHTGSFVEKNEDQYFNSSFLLSPRGEILAGYRKIHLFGYNSEESKILTSGTAPVVVKTSFGTLGMATCFDLRFPELFRAMVDKGAEIFLVCSAWPYPRLEPWIIFNKVRAMENQSFLISANAAGINRGTKYVGHSMVVDPSGTVVIRAGDEETIIKCHIDPQVVQQERDAFPALVGRKDFLNVSRR